MEVYPRPDGTIYLCGIGGSNYISKDELKSGAFREECNANDARVEAATKSFQSMSTLYEREGELDRTQACMRPCPPDAMPYMGKVPGYDGAYMNAGHNCWCVVSFVNKSCCVFVCVLFVGVVAVDCCCFVCAVVVRDVLVVVANVAC